MTKVTQREAVFTAVKSVLTEAGVKFEEGQNVSELMTTELRAQVNAILVEGFKASTIELKDTATNRAKLEDEAELKKYVSGLQSNWLNKDSRLNGATKYVPKNPGSRTGSQDPQIAALRGLMKTKTEADEIAEIQGYIDERLAQLATAKVKTKQVKVNFSDLPQELQAKYSNQ